MTPFIRRVLPDEDDDLFEEEDEDDEDDGWEGDEDEDDEDGEEEETWQVGTDGLRAPTRAGRQFA